MRYFLIGILLIAGHTIFGQEIRVNGDQRSPQLTWDDFKGKPDKSSPFFAYTYWTINYQYDAFTLKGDTVKWNVKIVLNLTNDSWKKKDKLSDSLLKHEQGHFDIGRICAAEAQSLVSSTVFLKNSDYRQNLHRLVEKTVEKYRKMNDRYDEETNHGKNRDAQNRWNGFFFGELNIDRK